MLPAILSPRQWFPLRRLIKRCYSFPLLCTVVVAKRYVFVYRYVREGVIGWPWALRGTLLCSHAFGVFVWYGTGFFGFSLA